MDKELKSPFIRWQGRTLVQMGYTINTLLIITTATIGFTVSYLLTELKTKDFHYYTILAGVGVLFFCAITTLWLIINRLKDFRHTTKKANREPTEVDTVKLGERTWCLFYSSVVLFVIGEIAIVIGFAIKLI
jgi:uncharacterized membrane protein YcjF (UPF0283 family)